MTAAVHSSLTWVVAAVIGRLFELVEQFDTALVVIEDVEIA